MERIINDEDENDKNLIMVSMSDVKNGKSPSVYIFDFKLKLMKIFISSKNNQQ